MLTEYICCFLLNDGYIIHNGIKTTVRDNKNNHSSDSKEATDRYLTQTIMVLPLFPIEMNSNSHVMS